MPYTSSHLIAPYAKSITAGVITTLGVLKIALPDGISPEEWVDIIVSALAATGLVWGVPNADPAGKHQDESVQPPADLDDGDWEH